MDNVVIDKKEDDAMVSKIVLVMKDGSTKEINKGMIVTYELGGKSEEVEMKFECCHMSGKDLLTTMYGVLEFVSTVGKSS